jgi:hypothetical protein
MYRYFFISCTNSKRGAREHATIGNALPGSILDATLVDKARNLPHRDGQPHQNIAKCRATAVDAALLTTLVGDVLSAFALPPDCKRADIRKAVATFTVGGSGLPPSLHAVYVRLLRVGADPPPPHTHTHWFTSGSTSSELDV